MKKITNLLVEKRYLIISLMMLFTLASVFMMHNVNINSDMTEYLPDNSQMKAGLKIMEKEFPTTSSSSFKIMFENLTTDEKSIIYKEISSIDGGISVNYDINSKEFNKENYTLYIVNTNYNKTSNEFNEILDSIKDQYQNDYTIYTAIESNGDPVDSNLLGFMIPIAVIILIVILLVMSASWFEPILFIFTISIAVLINMGTNVFLPSVSNMTFSIAAVIQLVLSMDYSIILMNRYRQEKENLPNDKINAMKNAISKSFKAISSSSATTIVGLLVLVFMSFKIGEDMGIVFAKGVFISLISIFTVLPSLILWTDNVLTKTLKRSVKGGEKNA